MPNKIETWECCVCWTPYGSEEAAVKCEGKHKKVVSYEPIFPAYTGDDGKFPEFIKVFFDDGSVREYRCSD